jgi:hypothetical protein
MSHFIDGLLGFFALGAAYVPSVPAFVAISDEHQLPETPYHVRETE